MVVNLYCVAATPLVLENDGLRAVRFQLRVTVDDIR